MLFLTETFLYLSQVWNDELATVAQTYAEKCVLGSNNNRSQQSTFTTVGENILLIPSVNNYTSYTELVGLWHSQVANYVYDMNICRAPAGCGAYTQVCDSLAKWIPYGWKISRVEHFVQFQILPYLEHFAGINSTFHVYNFRVISHPRKTRN